MFKVSQTDGTLPGFIKLFGIYPFEEKGLAFYRPIFREGLHNVYFALFGLNHIPFRVLLFLIHFLNIFFIFYFVFRIFQKKFISIFAAFFYGFSAANVSTLYYLSGGIEAVGATMFSLLTLILYKKYLEDQKPKFFVLSLVFFILALSSHEIVSILPFILLGLTFIFSPVKKVFRHLLKLLPFFIFFSLILYIDIFKIGFSPNEIQYKFTFNPKVILQSLIWYTSWAFGLPEMLLDFILPGLKLNPNLMRYWGEFYRIVFAAFAISFFLFLGFVVYLLKNSALSLSNNKFLFFLSWFFVGIAPVILLPAHKSSHYLVFTLPAFWISIGYISFIFFENLKKANKKLALLLLLVFVCSTVILSLSSAKLGEKNYWAATRGKLAKSLIDDIKNTYPILPEGATIYFTNDPNYPHLNKEWGNTSKQASIILNGSDALQLLYKDPALKVLYEDLDQMPLNISKEKLYIITAKIF